MNSYLLKIFYRKANMVEYRTQEFLLNGNSKNIDKIVKNEIKQFNEINKEFGYKVEQYNLFKFVKAESLKSEV